MGSGSVLFGIYVQERPTLQLADVPGDFLTWLQDAGGFAAVGLVIWMLASALAPRKSAASAGSRPFVLTTPVLVLAAISLVIYAVGGGLLLFDMARAKPAGAVAARPVSGLETAATRCFEVAGAFALIGLGLPFFRDLARLRWRRIWALTRLSFKEAIRSKVLWVFLAFLAIFLFPPTWFFNVKPEDELRTNVSAIYAAMAPLLLLTAALLAAFSIPNDLKHQTLHTVVTKPVERFEIVVGRFLGYVGLSTAVLFLMSLFSLLLILSSRISPEAQKESLKARRVAYGDLDFRDSSNPNFRGDSVGREWEYRRYIAGGPKSTQRAVWLFSDLDAFRGEKREGVPCEFALDIFRTTKGEEGQGVLCSFRFLTWQWGEADQAARAETERKYRDEVRGLYANAQPSDPDDRTRVVEPAEKASWEKLDQLADKYGYYEFNSKQVFDYHTLSVQVPPGLIRKALEGQPAPVTGPDRKQQPGPRLLVEVRCESPNQFIGAAKYDLYLLAGDGSFALNFIKGAVGIWLRLVIVVALAVTVSTYLSGVIAFLATAVLFGLGLAQDFIEELAKGVSVGGGPFEQTVRLIKREAITQQLEPTPTNRVAFFTDDVFRWVLRRLLNVIPDVDRLDWSDKVAEGFNIALAGDIGLSFLAVLAYLLPWGLLAYYLMKSREIAN
jgi:hypothetical protein